MKYIIIYIDTYYARNSVAGGHTNKHAHTHTIILRLYYIILLYLKKLF